MPDFANARRVVSVAVTALALATAACGGGSSSPSSPSSVLATQAAAGPTAPPPTLVVATASAETTGSGTTAVAAQPAGSTIAKAARTAQVVAPQLTAAPPVASTAAAPGATSAAVVPATRAAAVSPVATQPVQPQATAAVVVATSAAAAAASAPAAVPATREAVAAPASQVTVKGAFAQASSVQGVVYVARAKGFFARHGLDVQLSQVGGTQQVAALLSGDIQFGALGANEVANADLRGADLVMIATCADLPIFSLFANRKYASVADLAGQSIGVTNAGSATDAAAHLFLRQFNKLDQVRILPAGDTIPAILAAMDQGNLAGGVLSPPTTARAEESGYIELVNGARLGVPMNHPGIAISRGFLTDQADDVKSYLAAYQEAWTFSADPANKADVVAVLAQYTQSDDRLAEIGYQAMVPVWSATRTARVNPQAVANLLQVSGVPEAADAQAAQFFDDSLIDSLAPAG